jgi:two-component system, cell cycle sensor histidine kinase and response regulator CckA
VPQLEAAEGYHMKIEQRLTRVGERIEKMTVILVVDGNRMFREAAAYALANHGYEVLEAKTPKEAINLMELEGDRIEIVVSEVHLRGVMLGTTLVEALRKINRRVKAIFVSGYPDDAMKIQEPGDVHLLKPCRDRELLGKVQEILEAR